MKWKDNLVKFLQSICKKETFFVGQHVQNVNGVLENQQKQTFVTSLPTNMFSSNTVVQKWFKNVSFFTSTQILPRWRFTLPPLLVNNQISASSGYNFYPLKFSYETSFETFIHCVLGLSGKKSQKQLVVVLTNISKQERKTTQKIPGMKATHHFPFSLDVFDPKIKVKQGKSPQENEELKS